MYISALDSGQRIKAQDIEINKSLGIYPHSAWGYITYVSNGEVSFYLQKTQYAGMIEAKCAIEEFGRYFEVDFGYPKSNAYKLKKHYVKIFPKDFR